MRKGILVLIFCAFTGQFVSASGKSSTKIIVSEKDKAILQEKLDKFSMDRSLTTGALILKIGTSFMGTPYVGNTLDTNPEENLIVNLQGLDCTTFAENCLAIARTVKSDHPCFETFADELERIRYRNGKLNGYVSRLHYFGEWISNNASKGILEDVTAKIGGVPCPVVLNFMSTHPDSYPQLKNNPELIKEIRLIESNVSAQSFSFIPKDKIPDLSSGMMDGDVVSLVTKIPGMDVSHVGLLYKEKGLVYMLHASSTGGKVEKTRIPLADYLKNSKNTTGIFVARAK
jgi:hypothetical protein